MPNANRGAVGFRSDEFEPEYDRPSKSELKRQSNELQKLGEQLIEAPRDRVKRVPMPDEVKDAILMCQTISNHEGRRRPDRVLARRKNVRRLVGRGRERARHQRVRPAAAEGR